jgi:hypothetical protein
MPLHIADYLADTGHLTATEHGAYMLLIMHYWQNGHLPENEKLIARVGRMTPDQWEDDIIEKRRAAAEARYGRGKPSKDANELHVDSTCNDTGEKPFTDNLSSLRSDDASASDFETFWSVYPNKVGQPAAEKAFSKALKRSSVETIVAGAASYAAKTDDRQWCNPVKWLSEDRWKDQPAQPPDKPPPKPDGLSHLKKNQSREEYLRQERELAEKRWKR